MIKKSSIRILKKIIKKESYIKLNALLINEVFCAKEKLLFPYSKFSNYSILLTDKDPARNFKTRKNFNQSYVSIDFKTFNTNIDFEEYDLVVPITINDLLICSSKREAINQEIIPIPSLSTINICNNKDLLNATLQAAGLGHFLPGKNIQFPYILKGKIGEYSNEAFIIEGIKDERQYEKIINDPNYFK